LSVHTAGGVSDRHWLKARLTNGLTYLLTWPQKKFPVLSMTAGGGLFMLNGVR